MNNNFEIQVSEDLNQYLTSLEVIDKHFPDCPDVENKWNELLQEYVKDGVREFNEYPVVSLGWVMFLGMAVAKFWDEDWTKYSTIENLYTYLRDKRGYDYMDEYILQDVLKYDADKADKITEIAGECAARCHSMLMHSGVEYGTPEAFAEYVACLNQLYIMGMAMELKSLGYCMTELN